MTARVLGVPLLCAAVVLASAAASAQRQVPPRTFPQFAGTWALDEAASTGELRIAPRIPRLMTIAITPETISVTRRPRLLPNDRSSDSPPPEVYRLDGSETRLTDPRTNVPLDVSYRFTLVADMLALTTKESREGWNNGFTLVTDALAVDGDILTLHRQLVSVSPEGTIYTMTRPANNSRHTFVYRRQTQAAPAP